MRLDQITLPLDMHAFAERLRELREQRGLTQVRLAELQGMAPRRYNRWERGGNTPHLEMLIRIADILQVSLDELVGRSEPHAEPAIRNHELHQLVQQLDQLPDEDQLALIRVMDGLVKRTQIDRMVNKRAKPTRARGRRAAA